VEKVDIVKVDAEFKEIPGTKFEIDCDTLLISVGLIPENELIEMAGAALDKNTNSPLSEEINKTSIPGVFACGNSFKVYDIVDSVTRDSELCGKMAADYLLSKNE
jgi:thioredoxin reductase